MALRTHTQQHRHPHDAGDRGALVDPGAVIRLVCIDERGASRTAAGGDAAAAALVDNRTDGANCLLFAGSHAGSRDSAGTDEESRCLGGQHRCRCHQPRSAGQHRCEAAEPDQQLRDREADLLSV